MSNEDKSGEGQHKSIRKRLTGTVLVPSIALLVMWTAVSTYFVVDAIYVRTVASSVQEVSIPAVTALGAVQQERQLSLVYLEKPQTGLGELQEQQQEIDGLLTELRGAMEPVKGIMPDEIASRMRDLEADLDKLPAIRAEINLRTISSKEVNEFYNGLINTAAELFDVQARSVPDATATQGGIGATELFRAADQMSRAASLASSALANGTFSPGDHLRFSQLVGSYRSSLEELAPFLHPAASGRHEALVSGAEWQRLSNTEDALISQGPGRLNLPGGLAASAAEWGELTSRISTELAALTTEQADQVSTQALADANTNMRTVIIGSALALIAAIASIIVAVRVSRTLVDRTLMTRLERLRNDSLELARSKLPNIVRRLKEGEAVDVNAEMPRLDHGRDEIGQVAEAFNMAQLTAVNAAVSEAKARSGVNNVFLGIAHRNQGLVHRQLQILDRMESREENTEQLKGLFQLDNLATRARRTTENLIILGGKQPGRRWRKPVALMDVLRAAVSETEDFSRIEVENVPDVSLVGSAVADTIHLVAELVDNAATFSPPGSPVHMTSTEVARGVVVDVADQGLGMKNDVREWANRMMAEPPEFDAMALKADSSLGLFVVARLAARLGVMVTFDSSRYGGTRATILIPTEILANHGNNSTGGDSPVLTAGATVNGPTGQNDTGTAATNGFPEHRPDSSERPSAKPTEPTKAGTVMSRETDALHNGGSSPQPATPQPSTAPGAPATPAVPNARPEPDARPRLARRRAPLPQRQPQENLVSQLRDDPDSDATDLDAFSGRTRSTLSAFHKGTRRGRGAGGPEDQTSND